MNVLEAIAQGITDDILEAHPFVTIDTDLTDKISSIQPAPTLRLSRLNDQTWILGDRTRTPIGSLYLDSGHIHVHGLTDYTTSDQLYITSIELADPDMHRKICEAVHKLLELEGQHRLMRAIILTPTELAHPDTSHD